MQEHEAAPSKAFKLLLEHKISMRTCNTESLRLFSKEEGKPPSPCTSSFSCQLNMAVIIKTDDNCEKNMNKKRK